MYQRTIRILLLSNHFQNRIRYKHKSFEILVTTKLTDFIKKINLNLLKIEKARKI